MQMRHPNARGGPGRHRGFGSVTRGLAMSAAAIIVGSTALIASAGSASAWSADAKAEASCVGGKVQINGTFTNGEQKRDINVVMYANPYGHTQPVTVAHGSSESSFAVDSKKASIPAGQVTFEMVWSDGKGGSDTRTASYDAKSCGDNNGGHQQKVILCHATPPATAKNGWNEVPASVASVFKKDGHDSHAKDIIPAFDYTDKTGSHHYTGKNLDTTFGNSTGQEILDNGCKQHESPPPATAKPSGHIGKVKCSDNKGCVDVTLSDGPKATANAVATVYVDNQPVGDELVAEPGKSTTVGVKLTNGTHTIVLMSGDKVLAKKTVKVKCGENPPPAATVVFEKQSRDCFSYTLVATNTRDTPAYASVGLSEVDSPSYSYYSDAVIPAGQSHTFTYDKNTGVDKKHPYEWNKDYVKNTAWGPSSDNLTATPDENVLVPAVTGCDTTPPPPPTCKPGEVLKNGTCVTVVIDVCKNIDGNQSGVPAGMVKDSKGNCVTSVTHPKTPATPVGPKVVTDFVAPAAASSGSPWSLLTSGGLLAAGLLGFGFLALGRRKPQLER